MKKVIKLMVNGAEEEKLVESWWSLAHFLREELYLTGTKIGCGDGDCGACTVLVDGRAVKSCIYPVMKAKGKDILTIEGLMDENGNLHPLQQAFLDYFAVQCGYCTPGMILMAKELLDENPDITEDEVKADMSGNLCRCTGYVKIVEAIMAAREKMKQAS